MADNLLGVYKQGPYLHSNPYYFMSEDYTIPELRSETYINKLRQHYKIAKAKEQEFYDLVGVANAQEFSRLYLYNFGSDKKDTQTTTKKIQKILISIDSSLTLSSNATKAKMLPKLEKIASEIVTADKKVFEDISGAAKNTALKTLLEFLNKNVGQSSKKFTINNKDFTVNFPKRALTSETSAYIIDLLSQQDPEIKDLFKLTPQQKINKYKQYFFNTARQEQIPEEEIIYYWDRINKKLLSLKKHKGDNGNLSAFSNPFGAEGALGEIAIAITFEDVLGSDVVEILANDAVESYKQQYKTDEGAVIARNKQGEEIKTNYKSPTDLVITIGNRVYPIQIKTTYSELTAEKALKLQGSIYLQTLLGNLVSGGFMSNETANLFIYTLANLSTEGFLQADGADNKINMVLQILQMCLEYFAESHYAREIPELTTENMGTNMGNMFFVYSGQLVPISSFIAAAISAMEGSTSVVATNFESLVSYGLRYTQSEINQVPSEQIDQRISLGQNVYLKTRISELSFFISKLDSKIQTMINV